MDWQHPRSSARELAWVGQRIESRTCEQGPQPRLAAAAAHAGLALAPEYDVRRSRLRAMIAFGTRDSCELASIEPGAPGRTRTGMPVKARDFKSRVSDQFHHRGARALSQHAGSHPGPPIAMRPPTGSQGATDGLALHPLHAPRLAGIGGRGTRAGARASLGSAGEPPAAEVFLSHAAIDDYAFYLSPEAASMAPGVLQRFHAVTCAPPADLHRCTPMIL